MSVWHPEEISILGLAAPMLLKILRRREEIILTRIHGEYKTGRTDFLSLISEWSCIRDQITEITTVLSTHQKSQEKKHANTNS